ncbi:uncharacterized protein LOC134267349 [Saccostrea cucullata]|uniref:uncharacterized protein LOC134267349 n=1 Tax=Saccostrea cuccullata TaxID=36930 RepID=UPI002ED58125
MKFFIISLVLFLKGIFVNSRCSGKNGLVCCSGTVWDNLKQKCIECSPGYYGLNCTSVCQYPTYGRTCKFKCSCNEEFCDIAFGCPKENEKDTNRQVSKSEGALGVSRESGKTSSSLPTNVGKTYGPLTINDFKRIIKENDTFTWKLVFIIFASCSTCVTFIIICFVYKIFKTMKRPRHQPDKTSSVGPGEYSDCEMMEVNMKTENIIFEGLVNAKIGHNAIQNAYAIQLNEICPNSDIDQNAQGFEIKCGNSQQFCKSHLLSHGHGYVEPKIDDESNQLLRKDFDPECSLSRDQMLASEDRNQYLIATK